jgi:hypothetical protein
MIDSVINQFSKAGHQWPNRIVLRDNNNWYRVLDLQIKHEQNSMSVFMKTPLEGLYSSEKPINKFSMPKSGLLNIDLSRNIFKGKTYFNPYLTWHSSGVVHANAFESNNLKKDIFIKNSNAMSLLDIGIFPHIILTAVLPNNFLSYYATTPPPKEFKGNYLEISDDPYLPNKFDDVGPLNIVIDRRCLKSSSIILDVIIHDRNNIIDFEHNHPYPNNSEILFVHPPIQITPNNENLPALSLFFYQPIGTTIKIIQKESIIFWGRSKEQKEDILFHTTKI